MVRPKRSSPILTNAALREAAIRTIGENLDLGNGRTLKQYSQEIQSLRDAIAKYNSTLSTLDDLARTIKAAETKLRDSSEHMLLGVAAKYGKDSREYGQAGGVLKSERKRPLNTSKATTKATTKATAKKSSNPVIPTESILEETQPLVTLNGQSNVTSNGNGNGKTLVI
jgi:DNA repair ATPase RecN